MKFELPPDKSFKNPAENKAESFPTWAERIMNEAEEKLKVMSEAADIEKGKPFHREEIEEKMLKRQKEWGRIINNADDAEIAERKIAQGLAAEIRAEIIG